MKNLEKLDWRLRAIMVQLIVLVIATAIIYYEGIGLDPVTPFGAIFASWVGGLALFAVTGTVVTAVTLARPEHDSFDARARILLRGKSGSHIDYIISRISHIFEHYSEKTTTVVTIRSYNINTLMYRIGLKTTYCIRSYLDDVPTTFSYEVKYQNMTAAPEGCDPNRLMYIRIDGNPSGFGEDFGETFNRQITTRIDPQCSCEVSSELEFWVRGTEEVNNHKTKRYTQSLALNIENLVTPPRAVTIRIAKGANITPINVEIPQGETIKILELKNLVPETEAYKFWILSP